MPASGPIISIKYSLHRPISFSSVSEKVFDMTDIMSEV